MQSAKSSTDIPASDQVREAGAAAVTENPGTGNVEKIRDILFGSHMKDYDTRFRRLEESLLSQTAEIRETNRRRFDNLENYLKGEIEALQARLKAEREERLENVKLQSRELKELAEMLQQKLRDLDDRTSESDRALRDQLLQQSSDLLDEMRARHNQIASLVDRRSEDLNSAKTDRAMLAALFTEAAMRLNNEFKIPGTEG